LAREPRSARRQPHIARELPAVPIERVGGVKETAAPTTHQRRLTLTRRAAVTVWALVVVYRTLTDGLVAASIGRRQKAFAVVRDWLPFALVLVVYDLSRGAATLPGAPTLWHF